MGEEMKKLFKDDLDYAHKEGIEEGLNSTVENIKRLNSQTPVSKIMSETKKTFEGFETLPRK